MSNPAGFSDRLEQVLAGRVKNAWGKDIGLNSANITRMFRGEVPGPEITIAIMRKENVSLSWLLNGKGQPYLVHSVNTEEDFHGQLQELLREKWQTGYICNAPGGLSVVLTNPGQYDYKGTAINYTIVEILSGPADDLSLDYLRDASSSADASTKQSRERYELDDGHYPLVYQVRLNAEQAYKLSTGKLGTYALFGDERKDGVLSHPDGIVGQCSYPLNSLLPQQSALAEAADPKLLRTVIMQFENLLIEEGLQLDADARARAITAIYRHAAKSGHIDLQMIETVIETVR